MENNSILKFLNINSSLYKTRISSKFENRKKYQPLDPKMILSFIPGTVLDIMVKEAQDVEKGDDLMILDAMKMQNRLKSGMAGKIKKIHANKGDKVSKGTLLLELE
ncbi:MAG: acetyl-CoA carboxylase biotin carboxyl carrier protein subunit [Odoribacter sp.]|nr:acetyl-CoA carboxylase biotin carboxyl carrier protein subunit [Odoribacter sp.]